MSDPYCERCVHKVNTYGNRMLCKYGTNAIPVENQRHPKGLCGPDARLFDSFGMDDLELDYY